MTTTASPTLRPPINRVSRRAPLYWTARALTGWTALALAEVLWFLQARDGRAGWHVTGLLATAALGTGHMIIMPWWRYRVHRWESTAEAIYTQAGWFNQEQRIAPLSRIQTVDSRRGPIEQLFRLSNVTITTASSAGSLKIQGLDAGVAQRLVDELTAHAQASRGDAT